MDDDLVRTIRERAAAGRRLVVAIAGPPGAGKSTLAVGLVNALNGAPLNGDSLNGDDGAPAIVVPMDGFHRDNAWLRARGLLARKGAPETFDAAAFELLLGRIAADDGDVPFPLFDRATDAVIDSAATVTGRHRIVLVEGNYLLLDDAPWRDLGRHFGLTVFLDAPLDELERRLVRRWRDHGLDEEAARRRARGNDLANARLVVARSRKADIVVATGS